MIILDTNVLSDMMGGPSDPVRSWLDRVPPDDLAITSINRAEIRAGVARLPAGRRREELSAMADSVLSEVADRTLPFDAAAADRYARIVADRREQGRPIAPLDAQIAAIAAHHDAVLATRNVDDFVGCGVVVVDPFESG